MIKLANTISKGRLNMKKWLSLLLVASMSMATTVFADNEEETLMDFDTELIDEVVVDNDADKDEKDKVTKKVFSDITGEQYAWAYDAVTRMCEEGYINGYEDNTFRPDNDVTRLEVLALFSRALGASDNINEPVIDMAVDKYSEIIEKYDLDWGTEEIAFLMYRDVLTESDLVTYLKDDLKNEPMPRYEAAIIITKAMGGESAATSEAGVSLDYKDKDVIPQNALQYVAYVGQKGIMTGMEDGSFSPRTSVKRSQMAVMLSRTCDKTKYKFIEGKLVGIDVSGRLITYKDTDGISYEIGYSKNVVMNILGEAVTPKQMITGVDVIITKSTSNVVFVDTLASVPDKKIDGRYVSRATSNGVTRVTVYNTETGEKETYPCAKNLTVTYDNSPSTLANFNANDPMTLKIVNGEIETIIGKAKSETITNAVIEDIQLEPDFTITISHAKEEYDGTVIDVDTEASVRKNGSAASFSDIYPGDTVTLTLEYGKVISVIANSATKTVEGTIQELSISVRPSIKVKLSNGNENTYYVTNNVLITVNGEEKTLYDFRVGDVVKITLEGSAVTKITAVSSSSSNGKIEGTVVSVNTSYGFVKVAHQNSAGYTVEETVYCKDTQTKVMTDIGETAKVSSIKVGDTIIATGTTSNGAFTAKVIVISSSK